MRSPLRTPRLGISARGARFELGFLREDGILAFTATFDATDRELPGNGEVVLRLPELELLAGLYRVSGP